MCTLSWQFMETPFQTLEELQGSCCDPEARMRGRKTELGGKHLAFKQSGDKGIGCSQSSLALCGVCEASLGY